VRHVQSSYTRCLIRPLAPDILTSRNSSVTDVGIRSGITLFACAAGRKGGSDHTGAFASGYTGVMKPETKSMKLACGNVMTMTAPTKALLAQRVAQSNKDHKEGRGCPACVPVPATDQR
jgi:hypothetical protein